MTKNPNAQDLLQKSGPLIGSLTTFGAAYPQVAKLHLEIQALPTGFGKGDSYIYSLENEPGQYCPCPNPRCIGGGFDMGSFLHDLISRHQTSGEAGSGCRGHERMNRHDTRSCLYIFRAKAEIAYKDAATS